MAGVVDEEVEAAEVGRRPRLTDCLMLRGSRRSQRRASASTSKLGEAMDGASASGCESR